MRWLIGQGINVSAQDFSEYENAISSGNMDAIECLHEAGFRMHFLESNTVIRVSMVKWIMDHEPGVASALVVYNDLRDCMAWLEQS